MAKLNEYDWRGLPPDLVEFLGDLCEQWNQGKYPIRYDTPPTSATRGFQGESKVAKDGATWYLYIYVDDTDKWQKVALAAVA